VKANSIYTEELQEDQTSLATILRSDGVDDNEALAMSLDTAVLSYALKYARMRWPVFPLHGKIPIEGSHGHKDATTDEDKIREWYTKTPSANLAIKTGVEFFVLEVDPRHNGDKTMAALEKKHGKLVETIRQDSGGGGTHYLFALPTDRVVRSSESKVGPGIDVKGYGSHIVGEPSCHRKTGELYTFQNLGEAELAECPKWLLDLVCPLKTDRAGHKPPAPAVPLPTMRQRTI
jgi:hypothetical protein